MAADGERTVLHVLPHPGGGGDTYVDVLADMPGYRFARLYLAASARPAPRELGRGVAAAVRAAGRHDVLHVHGEAAAGLFLPLLATRPSVVTLHGLHLVRRASRPWRRVAALGVRAIVRAAGRTICVSEAEQRELRSVLGSAARGRAVVVHNGVPLPRRDAGALRRELRAELGLDDSPVGIWVGSLDDRRDPLAAVRAAERAAAPLLVVGDGVFRPDVERIASERIRILGHRRDVARLLSAADYYVLVSHREGFSFSLLEAMAHGLPPIVNDLPELVEAVGSAGIVVPTGDEQAAAAAMRRLVEHDGERMTLGEQARRRVAERFDAYRMLEGTKAVYDAVLARRGRRRG